LKELPPEIANCNAEIMPGYWSADTGTANTPASSFWVGESQRYSIDTVTGNFARQIAREIVPPYRVYERALNVLTWTTWERIDRGQFTSNRAGYRGSTSAQSIANNTSTTVTLTGTADHDGGGLSIASSIVTIGTAGTYAISGSVQFASAATGGRRRASIETWTGADPGVGAATQLVPAECYADTTVNPALNPTTQATLAAGAKVRLVAFQVSGASLNLLNNFGYPPQLNLALI
jgi:hypothetical protein